MMAPRKAPQIPSVARADRFALICWPERRIVPSGRLLQTIRQSRQNDLGCLVDPRLARERRYKRGTPARPTGGPTANLHGFSGSVEGRWRGKASATRGRRSNLAGDTEFRALEA